MRAARIGPTVCELLGPMPILKRSKTETAMSAPVGPRSGSGGKGLVLRQAETPHAQPEGEGGPGPQRGDAAVVRLVPAGAATGAPHGVLHALLQPGIERIGHLGARVDGGDPRA